MHRTAYIITVTSHELHVASNHQYLDYLINSLFRFNKNISTIHITEFCEEKPLDFQKSRPDACEVSTVGIGEYIP